MSSPNEMSPGTPNAFRRAMGDMAIALSMLTRLPIAASWFQGMEDRSLASGLWSFPLVGVIIGSIGGIGLIVATEFGLPSLVAALIALGLMMLATGALHEDGLADVCDGFGGGHDPATKLKIMRDSRIGSYGVLGLIIAIGIKAGALANLGNPGIAAGAIVAAATLSRATMATVMLALEPARKDGLGKMAGKPKTITVVFGLVLALMISVIVLPWQTAIVALVIALGGTAFLSILGQRQIGGFTGDLIGAAQMVSEVLVLCVIIGMSQGH